MPSKIEKWKELSREIAFQKCLKIEKVSYRLPDGKKGDFYLKKEGPAAAILALTKNNKVILVRQFRPGPNQILNELPGGYVGKDETPVRAAARELLEETGYRGKMKLVSPMFDCAYSTMRRYCVVATECEKVAKQNLDKTEFAKVVLVSLPSFRKLLQKGQSTDVEIGYRGLDYLGLL